VQIALALERDDLGVMDEAVDDGRYGVSKPAGAEKPSPFAGDADVFALIKPMGHELRFLNGLWPIPSNG
jgi:hypothetical protein